VTEANCKSDQGLGNPVFRVVPNLSDKNLIHIGIVDGKQAGKVTCAILRSLTSYF
jgi:hypothetical protein